MSELLTHPAVIALMVAVPVLLLAVRGLALGYPPPRLSTRILSAKEQAIVAACADALFPAGGPIPLSGTEAGLVEYVELYIARAPCALRPLMRLLFHSVEHSPWILGPRHTRFTRLSHADRIAVLSSMARSRIYFRRVIFLSLRTMLSMGYLANEHVARSIGLTSCTTPFERRAGRPAARGAGVAERRSLAPRVTA
jgi:hypothetical protein